ncbi:NAD(P)-dependent oxidoreductase [Chelatococcus sp. GCM10030263]|uniref:NAD(P)-dependent oxidoreductase n=1 Tax=Chelatococcus sp. GCM10030263 TaxID=3273387 RepID=UPI0036092438
MDRLEGRSPKDQLMSLSQMKVGLVGVGLMGHGIGKNLIEKGFHLTVLGHRNRPPVDDLVARGATEAQDAADLARRSDVVLVCVTGSPQVEALFDGPNGILAAARKGLVVVDCSTSEPASTLRLAEELAARGGVLVDAPLTRTPAEAEAGRLNTIVGAEPEVFAQLEPIFSAYCENIFHAGGLGSGHRLKLINNFLVMGNVALIAEAIVTALRTGVDLDKLYEVVSAGALASPLLQNILPKARAGEFDGVKFQLSNGQKDLRYYTHLTETAGVASFMGEVVHQLFAQASALGFGERFIPSLIEAQAKIHGESVTAR